MALPNDYQLPRDSWPRFMFPRAAPFGLWLSLLFVTAPAGGNPGPEPFASVLVAWGPGPEAVDAYNVYGIHDAGRTLLWVVPANEFSALVESGFSSYVVSGVKDGNERFVLLSVVINPCVTLDWGSTPPGVVVGNCAEVNPTLLPP